MEGSLAVFQTGSLVVRLSFSSHGTVVALWDKTIAISLCSGFVENERLAVLSTLLPHADPVQVQPQLNAATQCRCTSSIWRIYPSVSGHKFPIQVARLVLYAQLLRIADHFVFQMRTCPT